MNARMTKLSWISVIVTVVLVSVLSMTTFACGGKGTTYSVVTRAPLPQPTADPASSIVSGRLYVIGGIGVSHELLNNCQIYDPISDSWSQGAPMPTPRYGCAAAPMGQYIYVFGGLINNSGTPTPICERYDTVSNTWVTATRAPRDMGLGVQAIPWGSLILIFGYSVWIFDPAANGGLGSFTERQPVEARPADTVKGWCTLALVNINGQDRVYLIGGATSATITNTNYYYLPDTDTWVGPLAPAPYAAQGQIRENPTYGGKIYYALGLGGTFYPGIYSYDPALDTWSDLLASATPRDGLVGGFIGDTLYMVGGRNTNPAYGLAVNEAMQLSTGQLLP